MAGVVTFMQRSGEAAHTLGVASEGYYRLQQSLYEEDIARATLIETVKKQIGWYDILTERSDDFTEKLNEWNDILNTDVPLEKGVKLDAFY